MPLFILFVGILLIVAGINNKIPELVGLLKEDFRPTDGSEPFHVWIIAIAVTGALGYVKPLKGFSNAFLALIVIAMVLSNRGFFYKFTNALEGN